MRILEQQEVGQVAGGAVQLKVDVNTQLKYVTVLLVDGTKVLATLAKVDWSKWPTSGA